MSITEVFALIGLIIGAALVYWTGYRGGLIDGRIEGHYEGLSDGFIDGAKQVEAENTATITQLGERCQSLELLLNRKPQDRETLLAIAEKLKLAADTFHAVTAKGQAAQALGLRDQALGMADRIAPTAQERAA